MNFKLLPYQEIKEKYDYEVRILCADRKNAGDRSKLSETRQAQLEFLDKVIAATDELHCDAKESSQAFDERRAGILTAIIAVVIDQILHEPYGQPTMFGHGSLAAQCLNNAIGVKEENKLDAYSLFVLLPPAQNFFYSLIYHEGTINNPLRENHSFLNCKKEGGKPLFDLQAFIKNAVEMKSNAELECNKGAFELAAKIQTVKEKKDAEAEKKNNKSKKSSGWGMWGSSKKEDAKEKEDEDSLTYGRSNYHSNV